MRDSYDGRPIVGYRLSDRDGQGHRHIQALMVREKKCVYRFLPLQVFAEPGRSHHTYRLGPGRVRIIATKCPVCGADVPFAQDEAGEPVPFDGLKPFPAPSSVILLALERDLGLLGYEWQVLFAPRDDRLPADQTLLVVGRPRLREWIGDFVVYDHGDEDEQLVEIAASLQGALRRDGSTWPACPGHDHEAEARMEDFRSWWVCPIDAHRVAPIGDLRDATSTQSSATDPAD